MLTKRILFFILTLSSILCFSQVKVSGVVVDADDNPVPYANIVFKGSTTGTVSQEDGTFYLESDQTYKELIVSFLGFETSFEVWLVNEFPWLKKSSPDLLSRG